MFERRSQHRAPCLMIRLLIDENLPATLAGVLPVECHHATHFGDQLTDLELWSIAREQNLIILTRDADFFDRIILEGPPPKVIWVRLGNLRRKELEKLIFTVWKTLSELLATVDLIEIHPTAIETFSHPNSSF